MTQLASNANANMPDQNQEKLVMEAVQEISHIATLPQITLKIIQLVEDPNSTASDLNKIISNDPALGARILKVVNSAFYGLPGQIGSINRAIVLLGLNAVKNIAIAASLAKLFRGGQISQNFSARELWVHSIGVATGTQLLSKEVGLGLPDEAFLAGLIHDIGIVVEAQARRPKFVEAVEKMAVTPGLTLRQAELSALGATHEQFGAALCKNWKFPSAFAYVTGFHHRPMELSENHRTLACLVHIADITVAGLKIGYTHTVESTEVGSDVMEAVGLPEDRLVAVAEALPAAMEEAMALLT
ncbi:MAG: HDOD domain-containing protein [Phycisphaerales bacterium]|nr:HDOD domain-containing protein [Phycisphaerales bacterium]